MICQLKIIFPGRALKADEVDRELALLIYVGDMATPKAAVNIADLIRQRGVRPLNVLIDGAVKVVLVESAGTRAKVRPEIEFSVKVNK